MLTAATGLLLAACAEKPAYEIQGTVDRADAEGKYVYLLPYGSDEAPLDSALIANGKFVLKGEQATPKLCVLRIGDDDLNVLKNSAVGKPFIDFEMADAKGKTHKLSEYVGKGKIVLIDFWASWCPPCRRDMPNMVEVYKQYKSKGFEIVGISLDSKQEAWEKGVKDLQITWPQLSDLKGWKNDGAALYGVNSIPHTVLVDKDGTILAKGLHAKEIGEKLKELLK